MSQSRRSSPRSAFEAVAHARFGDQVAGAGRVLLELAAQLGEVDAQVAGLVRVRRAPDLAEQLLLADQASRVAHEHLQHVPLGWGEAYVGAAADDLLGRQVDGEV